MILYKVNFFNAIKVDFWIRSKKKVQIRQFDFGDFFRKLF